MDIEKSGQFYLDLFDNQIVEIITNQKVRLNHNDILRIFNKMSGSIFNEDCVFYDNKKNNSYLSFFKKETCGKIPLKRLLYMNYVNPDLEKKTLKSTCGNKGCCCLEHIYIVKRHKVQFVKFVSQIP